MLIRLQREMAANVQDAQETTNSMHQQLERVFLTLKLQVFIVLDKLTANF